MVINQLLKTACSYDRHQDIPNANDRRKWIFHFVDYSHVDRMENKKI